MHDLTDLTIFFSIWSRLNLNVILNMAYMSSLPWVEKNKKKNLAR